MNNDILVTIAIPVYNAEKFIKFTLDSTLSQTYQNFELIITDDGSNDKTVEIIKSYKDPRIKLHYDNLNKGISYRLNQQIDLAKGKYFFRMDADDIMFPERVEKQIEYLENHIDVDVVGSAAVIIGDNNEIIGLRNSKVPETYEESLQTNAFIHPTVCGKLEWFKKNKYNEDYIGAEDFDLWLRTWKSSKFAIINEPLIFYRDPLKFKLKTYKFRLRQQRKIFKNDLYLQSHPIIKKKLFLISYIKSFLATLVNKISLDDYYIARRNKRSSDNQNFNKYKEFLVNYKQ